MLENLAFWLAVGAAVAFFRFTQPRQRFVWGRIAAGALLLVSLGTLVYDMLLVPLSR